MELMLTTGVWMLVFIELVKLALQIVIYNEPPEE